MPVSASQYLAIDLGAESGRVMVGHITPDSLHLTEAHRFPNLSVRVPKAAAALSLQWDILRLWHEIQIGLAKAASNTTFAGIGVDTWGVDFALVAHDGSLLANPTCYRDGRTVGMPEKLFASHPKQQIYARTGIQTMPLNTLFQLASLHYAQSPILAAAGHLLFIPDLLCYWLTGRLANEYTIASTSQMLDAQTGAWAPELLAALNLSPSLFPELLHPATADSLWGRVQPGIGDALALTNTSVFAVGSHDTASAVVAVPVTGDDDWLYLSSGTWSLLGAEVSHPVLSEKAFRYNLTNEGGVGKKIRLLKNIAGLWLLQECRGAWAHQGNDFDYPALVSLAEAAPSHSAIIDPDDAAFASPGDMPEKIAAYCRRTQQPVPGTPGTFVRVVLESLAVVYARVHRMLEDATGKTYSRLHIVGGGSQNNLLNQMAADATGLTVYAGPVEATALGNILSQAISTGQLESLATARALIARSHTPERFTPRDTEKWQKWIA